MNRFCEKNAWTLGDGEVHVWQAELDPGEAYEHGLRAGWNLLSPAEQKRATDFKFESDRTRWIVARAILRRLLAGYLSVPPADVQMGISETGKPFVSPPARLEFNLSHSGNTALYAFSRKEVGIDVEALREVPEALAIAATHFPEADWTAIAACCAEDRSAAFLRCWVRHEALLKAQGGGLSGDQSPRRTAGSGREWDIVNIDICAGYVAALAMPSEFTMELRVWPWVILDVS